MMAAPRALMSLVAALTSFLTSSSAPTLVTASLMEITLGLMTEEEPAMLFRDWMIAVASASVAWPVVLLASFVAV